MKPLSRFYWNLTDELIFYDRSLFTLKKGEVIVSLHPIGEVRTEKTTLSTLKGYRIVVKSSGADMMEITKLLQQKTVI